jgi:multiple sugar transport system permease protein
VLTIVTCLGVWMLTTPGPAPMPSSPEASVMSTETGLTDLTAWSVANSRSNAAVIAAGVTGLVVTLGLAIGPVFFRTLFYLPSLLAGVAMFLLWKALYRPQGGLINAGLQPILDWVSHLAGATPAFLWLALGVLIALGAVAWSANLLRIGFLNLARGEAGFTALLGRVLLAATVIVVALVIGRVPGNFPVAGLAGLVASLPQLSSGGLSAPSWLVDPAWAKTALIIMGVWCGVGGGNMLLYLAGLSNVPPELYEAAAIDGASSWQRFKHVTWPQLAPTTFFIVIMSAIGGLQGGFEQAMVMTGGAADTRVLAYYIWETAFKGDFSLGLASAIAWVMFAFIFVMTILNFRLGSRITND